MVISFSMRTLKMMLQYLLNLVKEQKHYNDLIEKTEFHCWFNKQ